ncbi:hypothetical protein HPB49_018925 [Dermacentor silvarum]|uniref:Uncharacterized protein n=1 Tax=Dermacentor silvarum TaxID=543639 RepID=A0ACB8D7P9_DERSI|nr:hypothetical protein HPB49_018925 [Dermacentor silvarum]
MNLTVITDKAFPTRTGKSMQRDTSPDLCFVKNITDVRWFNLAVHLGSGHFLLAVHFPTVSRKTKTYTWVDWDLFRKTRAERPPPYAAPSLETWTDQEAYRDGVFNTEVTYTYARPFIPLKHTEKDCLDRAPYTSYKLALRLLLSTARDRLLALGIHNTTEEIIQAQRVDHQVWLTSTPAGRDILTRLKISPPVTVQDRHDIPHDLTLPHRSQPSPKTNAPDSRSRPAISSS